MGGNHQTTAKQHVFFICMFRVPVPCIVVSCFFFPEAYMGADFMDPLLLGWNDICPILTGQDVGYLQKISRRPVSPPEVQY